MSHSSIDINKEEHETQAMIWLIYKLLDDESKRVIILPSIEALIPQELNLVYDILINLTFENK